MRYFSIILFILTVGCSSCLKVWTEIPYNTKRALEYWQIDYNVYYEDNAPSGKYDLYVFKLENSFNAYDGMYHNGKIESKDEWMYIAHEVGHYLGFSHSTNSLCIMFPHNILENNATNKPELVWQPIK